MKSKQLKSEIKEFNYTGLAEATYDKEVNCLSFYLKVDKAYKESEEINARVIVDFDKEDNVMSVEIFFID